MQAALESSHESTQNHQARWYALYTCSRHEKRVAEQIERRQLSCFLPSYRCVRRWKDRRKELELALFPGYVFVHMSLSHKLKVLQVPGVVQLVSFQGQPAALPAEEIEALRNRISGNAKVVPHPYLQAGRKVRVHSGPFQGLEGVIVRRKDRCRLIFSIDLIQRSLAIELDESDLEAA
jgi:transcription elongation factor/antiterminator RfaH